MMNTINMMRTQYRVSDFISWQKSGTLELSPSFQRRPIWPAAAKSYLIDTVVRGLPIPIIFLRERKSDLSTLEPKREVVDGQQRLRTLISYISPKALKNFNEGRDAFMVKETHNEELAEKRFEQLRKDLQQRILDYQFSVHVLPSDVDDREVLEIFARMNATGIKLNDQELRNAAWFGKFKTSMYHLAYQFLAQWRKWGVLSENEIARMQEVELTSEFTLLILNGLMGKSQKAIDNIYKQKDETYPERKASERRFQTVMEAIDDGLGADMPVLPYHKKALIYPLFAVVYHAMFGIMSSLKKKTDKPLPKKLFTDIRAAGEKIEKGRVPEKVLEAIARRTTHAQSRKIQFDFLLKECKLA
ncbi:MAG: DUF262 domain-containing protein [Nitrospirae bacterium]|nr:DUF262 domain-containing protein [Nitrospirota bacterium]